MKLDVQRTEPAPNDDIESLVEGCYCLDIHTWAKARCSFRYRRRGCGIHKHVKDGSMESGGIPLLGELLLLGPSPGAKQQTSAEA